MSKEAALPEKRLSIKSLTLYKRDSVALFPLKAKFIHQRSEEYFEEESEMNEETVSPERHSPQKSARQLQKKCCFSEYIKH
jgi:hypothetical protein